MTLTLVAKIFPPLFVVALGVYVTWCQAIAFVGGTIPLVGWELEGGFLTGILWGLFGTGPISGVARLVLHLLLAAIGRVIPLTVGDSRSREPVICILDATRRPSLRHRPRVSPTATSLDSPHCAPWRRSWPIGLTTP